MQAGAQENLYTTPLALLWLQDAFRGNDDLRAETYAIPSKTVITTISTILGWEASLGMPIAHACTDPGFPNRHSAAGQKANLGSPAFSESLLLTCQFSSYSSSGTLMGPGRYQRCTLHTEHLIDCKYSLTVLLSQPLLNTKSMVAFFSKSLSHLPEGQTWTFWWDFPAQLQAIGIVSSPFGSLPHS